MRPLYVSCISMSRQKLAPRLDAGAITAAKERGINLSGFPEIKLVEHLTQQERLDRGVLPSGFEC